MLKKQKIQIEGLHCSSCKTLLETEIDILAGVSEVEVNYQNGECQVQFDDDKISISTIISKIESFDYKVIINKSSHLTDEPSKLSIPAWLRGLLIPTGFGLAVAVFFLFRHFGGFEILSRLNDPNIGYWLILLIGFLASFHCVGMCGGLVVAYSAGEATKRKGRGGFSWSHLQYNGGRLISYTIIGGILGGIGSFFGINPSFGGTVMFVAGIFMLLMALSLYTNFSWLEKIKLKTPQFIARYLYNQKHDKKPKGPFIIGLFNGLMPCGPLQAMQLYALGTGSVTRGALSMAMYALGTVPLMFGFGAFITLLSKKYLSRIGKISAIIVAILALVMINRGLVNFGYGFGSGGSGSSDQNQISGNLEDYQEVRMGLSYRGYSPNVLYAKKGVPVRWVIDVTQMSGCTNAIIMPEYGIERDLVKGENIIEWTPDRVGEVKFSCWMRMVWGKFIITE